MNILIPVDNTDIDEAQIVSIDDVKHWLLIEFDEGKIIKSECYIKREDISVWIDVMIVINNKEYVWPFMEENIAVLMAPFCESIDEIVEAYLYKELHDFNIGM